MVVGDGGWRSVGWNGMGWDGEGDGFGMEEKNIFGENAAFEKCAKLTGKPLATMRRKYQRSAKPLWLRPPPRIMPEVPGPHLLPRSFFAFFTP